MADKLWRRRTTIPLYGPSFHVWIGSTEALRAYVKGYPLNRDDVEKYGHARGQAFSLQAPHRQTQPWHVVWLESFDSTMKDISDLAHECTHAASDVLENAGIPVRAENNEALAYLVSWMLHTALRMLWKEGKYKLIGKAAHK